MLESLNLLESRLILFIASLVANFFSSLAGGGAGLIQLPVIIFLGLPFGIALATHKVATVALGLGASLRHLREKNLLPQFILIMLISGMPGVITGANIILQVPEKWSLIALGLLTIGISAYSFVQKDFGTHFQPRNMDIKGSIAGGIFSWRIKWFINFGNRFVCYPVADTLVWL